MTGQPEPREGQAGPFGVADGSVRARKPGNAGRAKGPQFKTNARSGKGQGDWTLFLEPPGSVQKLQTALLVKAKGAPDYRFYLLYDKVYRKDVLAYAYQRCKANKEHRG